LDELTPSPLQTNNQFLAGLILANAILGNGDGDDTAAILGTSDQTNPGQAPESNKNPSFGNRDTETAIWTYNRADDSLIAVWVNYAGQTPASTSTFIYYISNGDKFYLTSSSTTPQNGVPVVSSCDFFWLTTRLHFAYAVVQVRQRLRERPMWAVTMHLFFWGGGLFLFHRYLEPFIFLESIRVFAAINVMFLSSGSP
jgi:hypothetical protein